MDHLHSDGSRPSEIVTPAAESDVTEIERFIEDMAASVYEVKGTPRQIEIYKASLRFAITYAKRIAAHRTLANVKASTVIPDRSQADASEVAR